MAEVRLSERCHLDTREVGDGTSNTTMAMAIEMVTAVTPIARGSRSAARLEPMMRNENGKWRRRSEAPGAAFGNGDWRSRSM